MKKILRVDEAASLLRVSRRTVYRLVSAGHLPAFKILGSLRISSQALEAYIDKQTALYELENGISVSNYDSLT